MGEPGTLARPGLAKAWPGWAWPSTAEPGPGHPWVRYMDVHINAHKDPYGSIWGAHMDLHMNVHMNVNLDVHMDVHRGIYMERGNGTRKNTIISEKPTFEGTKNSRNHFIHTKKSVGELFPHLFSIFCP